MFMASTSRSMRPAVCAASTTNRTPRSRQMRPTSVTFWMVPMTLEPWFITTSRVSLVMRAAMSSG
jgi:hypothetical protein